MSIDQYKAEANRLATHLADVHGVKLKHASVLSAIAAIHGARDWNTLVGSVKRGLFQRATAALRSPEPLSVTVSLGQLLFQATPKGMRFGLSRDQTCPAEVAEHDLRQHTLIIGPMGYGWRTLVEHLAVQQVVRGGGVLVLDTLKDERLPSLMAAAAVKAGRADLTGWADLGGTGTPAGMIKAGLDPFMGTDTELIVKRLLCLLPSTKSNPGADFYRGQCQAVLTAIIFAYKAMNKLLDLNSLSQLLQKPRELLTLAEELSTEAISVSGPYQYELNTAWRNLDSVIRQYISSTSSAVVFDETRFKQSLGGFIGRLALMSREGVLSAIPADTAPLNLSRAIKNRECVYVATPLMDKDSTALSIARMLLKDLTAAVAAEMSPGNKTQNKPLFTVILPLGHSVLNDFSPSFLAQARALGIAFIFHVPSLLELEESGVAEAVLGNTATKVFFKPSSPRALSVAAEYLESIASKEFTAHKSSSWTVVKSEPAPNWKERLANLGPGEALLDTKGHLRSIHCCMLTLDDQ